MIPAWVVLIPAGLILVCTVLALEPRPVVLCGLVLGALLLVGALVLLRIIPA